MWGNPNAPNRHVVIGAETPEELISDIDFAEGVVSTLAERKRIRAFHGLAPEQLSAVFLVPAAASYQQPIPEDDYRRDVARVVTEGPEEIVLHSQRGHAQTRDLVAAIRGQARYTDVPLHVSLTPKHTPKSIAGEVTDRLKRASTTIRGRLTPSGLGGRWGTSGRDNRNPRRPRT